MRIDLHTHSAASDGTQPPAELVREAARAGLDVLGLTDHDTTSGWAEAAAALPPGLTLVPGAELSCRADGVSMHLLAYLFDPAHEGLSAAMARVRDSREPRLRELVRRLRLQGVEVTFEEVLEQVAPGATPGRPHVADALVAKGVYPHRDQAFADVLHSRAPAYVPHESIDPLEAVRLVRAAGGVPVFAHPRAARRGRIVPDSLIEAMAAEGLAALEVDHPDHDDGERAHLRALAARLGLLMTGASDYHGTGKHNRLGQEETAAESYERLVAQAGSGVRPVVRA